MQTVTVRDVADLVAAAGHRARRRVNHNLHPCLDDPVQRLLNVLRRGTYVRPHRHVDPPRWELFVILSGRAAVLELAPDGEVLERCDLHPGSGAVAVEIAGGSWHTVVATGDPSVLFEVKPGPYSPIDDPDVAPWAPAEGEPDCARLVGWFERARGGDRPPRPA